MSLYRLDFLNDDDTTAEAVRDPILGGDLLTRHMTTARKRAIETAEREGRAILITRIHGAGQMRACLRIMADGTPKRPSGTVAPEREDCARLDSRRPNRTCFCSVCRAERDTERRAAIAARREADSE